MMTVRDRRAQQTKGRWYGTGILGQQDLYRPYSIETTL